MLAIDRRLRKLTNTLQVVGGHSLRFNTKPNFSRIIVKTLGSSDINNDMYLQIKKNLQDELDEWKKKHKLMHCIWRNTQSEAVTKWYNMYTYIIRSADQVYVNKRNDILQKHTGGIKLVSQNWELGMCKRISQYECEIDNLLADLIYQMDENVRLFNIGIAFVLIAMAVFFVCIMIIC
jgi:hypothetical protein